MKIKSYIGLDEFNLSDSRTEIRIKANQYFKTFNRSADSINSADFFPSLNLNFEYDEDDFCTSIEVYEPNDAIIFDKRLMNLCFDEALEFLSNQDSNLINDSPCLISKKLGISLYFETNEDEVDVVKAVLIFKEGYFDSVYL